MNLLLEALRPADCQRTKISLGVLQAFIPYPLLLPQVTAVTGVARTILCA